MLQKWWISCPWATGQVDTIGEWRRIVNAPPVWNRFLGQPLNNLTDWLATRFGGVKVERLNETL